MKRAKTLSLGQSPLKIDESQNKQRFGLLGNRASIDTNSILGKLNQYETADASKFNYYKKVMTIRNNIRDGVAEFTGDSDNKHNLPVNATPKKAPRLSRFAQDIQFKSLQ